MRSIPSLFRFSASTRNRTLKADMEKNEIRRLHKLFEDIVHQEDDRVEFWYARDLLPLLEYAEWRNFSQIVEKAKIACHNSGVEISSHFVDVNKMVDIGSGAQRAVADIKLTRYACYLIAQNGDPRKGAIAFAQTYFAVQTRKQELIETRLKEARRIEQREHLAKTEKRLAGVVFERGVDGKGFARIKSRGDEALFGGQSTQQMKEKLLVPPSRALADFLPTVTITAKALANEITEHNVINNDLNGESPISREHQASNKAVRQALVDRNVVPERLPPAEDLQKVQSRVSADNTKLPKRSKQF